MQIFTQTERHKKRNGPWEWALAQQRVNKAKIFLHCGLSQETKSLLRGKYPAIHFNCDTLYWRRVSGEGLSCVRHLGSLRKITFAQAQRNFAQIVSGNPNCRQQGWGREFGKVGIRLLFPESPFDALSTRHTSPPQQDLTFFNGFSASHTAGSAWLHCKFPVVADSLTGLQLSL